MRVSSIAPVIAAIALGCGGGGTGLPLGDGGPSDGGSGDGNGLVVPGGGTSGGPLNGKINVMVVEDKTDVPIPGAFVQVGETQPAQTGTTDAAGFISFSDAALMGPLMVTAGKGKYRTATYTDVDATNVTIVLQAVGASKKDTGTMRGTVDFAGLPPITSSTKVRAAFVLYQLSEGLRDPRLDIPQPATGGIPDNTYIPGPPANKNEWVLVAPAGTVNLFALIVEVETGGSFDPAAWSYQLTHIAILDGQTLAKGEDKGMLMIPRVAALDQALMVTVPMLPPTMTALEAFMVINRGPGKLVPVLVPGIDYTKGIPGPKLEGFFAGATIWVVATANNANASTGQAATQNTVSVTRGVTSYGTAVAVAPFMGVVGTPAWAMNEISYTPVADASFLDFTVSPAGGDQVWDIIVLDKMRTKVRIPDLPTGAGIETIPPGMLTLGGNAALVPGFNPQMASFKDLANVVAKISGHDFAGTK